MLLNALSRNVLTVSTCVLTVLPSCAAGPIEELGRPIGWTFYNRLWDKPVDYAATPLEACETSAWNHFRERLISMKTTDSRSPLFWCIYKNPFGGLVREYTPAMLICPPAYFARWPGVCVKRVEPPRPATCSINSPGYTIANPVVVSSGAKVQTETDLEGTPLGLLRVARTYRTFRDQEVGQSAGQGWSFSFDRHFEVKGGSDGMLPFLITGTMGDGSVFEFHRNTAGKYISRHDKREVLAPLDDRFQEWVLTTAVGTLERFRKSNDRFLLQSVHSKEGSATFYQYDAENRLVLISDSYGRQLTVEWTGKVIGSVSGLGQTTRYRYDFSARDNGMELPGTERLIGVEYYDESNQSVGSRQYHYEDARNRYLMTGITDENGNRFATYAYNVNGQVVLSESAGGANRHTFSYPSDSLRSITDPLGTVRTYGISYKGQNTAGLITSVSQPAGAGCAAATRSTTYDALGRRSSSTDFNENKTCSINDPVSGQEVLRDSGLSVSTSCPKNAGAPLASGGRRVARNGIRIGISKQRWLRPERSRVTFITGRKIPTVRSPTVLEALCCRTGSRSQCCAQNRLNRQRISTAGTDSEQCSKVRRGGGNTSTTRPDRYCSSRKLVVACYAV